MKTFLLLYFAAMWGGLGVWYALDQVPKAMRLQKERAGMYSFAAFMSLGVLAFGFVWLIWFALR